MKKNFLFILSLAIFISSTTIAQSLSKKEEKITKAAAKETCECFNKIMSSFHPEITKMMKNMVEIGEDAAIQEFTKYMMTLSEEEQKEFIKEAERLKNMESMLDEQCGHIEKKYAKYKDNDAFGERVIYHLENDASCKLLGEIMKKAKDDEAKKD